jgi:gas vesicle protein
MRYLLTFLSGVFVGAAAALLFAPMSGEELRTQLQEGAEAEFKRAQAEWHRASAELNTKVDEISQQLKTLIEQEEAEAEAEPAA